MMFWWAHHRWSRRYGLDDGSTVVLSILLVLTVLVYVHPLRYMASLFVSWIGRISGLPLGADEVAGIGPGELHAMFATYGVGFVAMCGAILLLYLHAWRRREALQLTEVGRFDTLTDAGMWAIHAGTGLISVLVAFLVPPSYLGLPGWVYMVLPVVMPVYGHRTEQTRLRLIQSEEAAGESAGDSPRVPRGRPDPGGRQRDRPHGEPVGR